MKKIYTILVCMCMLAGFVACEKDKEFVLTTLTVTNETVTSSYETAEVSCSFKADATISEAYVQYSLSSGFAKYDVAKMTEEKGKYMAQLTDLVDNTTYYIRYAVSNKYSSVVTEEVVECQTLQCTVPTIVLDSVGEVRESHAKAYLHLTFDGGASVTDIGICWSKQANPTIEDIHKSTKDTVAVLDMTDLQENTKYYVRAYAVNKVGTTYSEEQEFTTSIKPKYVDLGLPSGVKWATFNVGANSPEESGDYYAWGETSPKSSYTWLNYKWCEGSYNMLTKYNCDSSKGVVDYKTILDPEDDAATVNWGQGWRIPTKAEFDELIDNCTWTWSSINGVYGYEVKSNTNGNSIFLPSVGYYSDNTFQTYSSSYSSSSLGVNTTPYFLNFNASYIQITFQGHRSDGYAIRPVSGDYAPDVPTVITSNVIEITETTAVAGGNVTADGNASVTERGIVYGKSPNPTISNLSNTIRPCGSGMGEFTYNMTDLQPGTTYFVRAYATNEKGTAYGEEVIFTTNKQVVLPSVITAAITQITETSAVAGGNVTNDGGASVTERGVVYATTQNPTTADNKLSNGSGMGTFTCNLTDLQPNTKYYVRAYAINEKGTAYGEEVSFTTKEVSISDPTGTENGYGYVDLGLSIKWATMNVGASKPEDYGDYFAWGETSTKSTYNWSTYTLCKGYSSTLTKYNTSSSYGTVDNKTTLELSDDAAHANWGGNWRMPTSSEWTELRENCTWIWITQNGKNGYKVTSRSNGNSIFLRAAGYRIEGSHEGATNNGLYWSSSLDTDYTSRAWGLDFGSSGLFWMNSERYVGYSVRPVLGESVVETTIPTVTTTIPTQITETTAVAGGNVTSDGGASVTERGVVYSTNPNPVITNLNNTIRPCGSGIGAFTYNMTGLQSGTTYYVRAYATNEVGTAYGEEVTFTTKANVNISDPTGTENGYGYVDLGLSVKWATMNVGASSPEDYGDYFAWGETKPKTIYDWSTYDWCNGSLSTLTKYNNSSSYGTIVDNKTQLELTDDAARANWGGAWRMPTDAELTELHEQCTWTWTTQNGVNGYKVTSKSNGNSIFLPAAGFCVVSSLRVAGSQGNYWSSSLSTDNPNEAWGVTFSSGHVGRNNGYRAGGWTVRPVCQ